MSKARLVITAVVVEGRSQSEVARAYGVSQPWVSRLVARYRAEGEAAFKHRSRRPAPVTGGHPPEAVELVLRLRKQLAEQGLDAGAHTIGWHLRHTTTSHRRLARHGVADPDPPRADRPGPRPSGPARPTSASRPTLPNEMWQTDFTHYRLRRRRT